MKMKIKKAISYGLQAARKLVAGGGRRFYRRDAEDAEGDCSFTFTVTFTKA